jgi:hypothetical protein
MKHTLRLVVSGIGAALVAGCAATQVSPVGFGVLPEGYTCCNLHHVDGWISDGNWGSFPMIPAGTPIRITGYGSHRAYAAIGGMSFRIGHDYGRDQATLDQYVARLVVKEDPRAKIEAWPDPVREAIRSGRLRHGMTREQAIIAAGYPATHRTPVIEAPVWTYWNDRLSSYQVRWDGEGRIADITPPPIAAR